MCNPAKRFNMNCFVKKLKISNFANIDTIIPNIPLASTTYQNNHLGWLSVTC